MNQRERLLSILVGGALALFVLQWGFNKYRDAIKARQNQIASLENEKVKIEEQLIQKAYADRQMGEYVVRSLPSDIERAQADYQKWLLSMLQENGLRNFNVGAPTSIPVGGLYHRFGLLVTGETSMPELLQLLHAFYAKDYLHRINKISFNKARTGEGMQLTMNIDAIALNAAPADAAPPESNSWRVEPDAIAYVEPIMNRNLFEPPNKAPRYDGKSTLEAVVGKSTPAPLTFKDDDGDRLRYELAEDAPEYVSLDERSGTLRIDSDEKREFEILVRAIDDGYPKRTTEQKLTVRVVDPPPPPTPEPPKPKFDDATQTILTGLVQGRERQAWLQVRTHGKTLKLRVGDKFEIGSVKGTVVGMTSDSVDLEIEGRRLTLKQNGNLGEAAKRAEEG
tara:strand:+ start:199816 stop:200997 length:1182 start_codon:yes stop_codon:yes gene_type:complete